MTKPEPAYYGHPLFYKIVEELKRLHSEKSRQYATTDNPLGNFVRCGKMISKFLKPSIDPVLAACMFLMAKQVDAVYDMVAEGKQDTYDSLDDKFSDISVYSIIARIIIAEKRKEQNEHPNRSSDDTAGRIGGDIPYNTTRDTNPDHDTYCTGR
jgi:hypothetical protein